jgi:hypothetical protein
MWQDLWIAGRRLPPPTLRDYLPVCECALERSVDLAHGRRMASGSRYLELVS